MSQSDERGAWELAPFEAIGPLRMGMTENEVAATLRETPKPLSLPPGVPRPPTTEEAFRGAGVHVAYDREGRLLAVESVDRPVTYRGIPLYLRLAEDVRADLERIGVDSAPNDEGNGFDVPELGLMLYVPGESDHEPPDTVLAVMATRRDYAEVVRL